jgi:hypothetical protein
VLNFMSTAHGGPAARDPAGFRSPSASVEVIVRGWRPADGPLDSHGLCLLLRDGGVRLGEALDLTKAVLDGKNVRARLPFADAGAAVRALARLGATAAEPGQTSAAAG